MLMMIRDYHAGPQLAANSLLENMNNGIADIIFSPAQIGQTGQGPAGDFPTKLVSSISIYLDH